MPFNQEPPRLHNQYDDDRVLRGYLARALPVEMQVEVEPALREMGALAAGRLLALQHADRLAEPRHTPFDAWGNRIDRIELTPLWREAEPLAARAGLVAIPYERAHGALSRVHQFALVYLFTASSDVYSCPLAMTDGAARTLLHHADAALIERALPHLTARDPAQFWTSGQWMTESTGGSDVGSSETIARPDGTGWRLHGRKWFTSAATSQMALTLARPEGNAGGGKGLALFYLETRDAQGRLDRIVVHRLKDKLGTRKVPTAELTLEGTPAVPVAGLQDGVRNIAPMLNVTRTWNSVSSVAYMRRAIALARDYARRRFAFGAKLADKPLHQDTLAGMQAEFEAGFHLAFLLAETLGAEEAGTLTADGRAVLRLLTPLVKLLTGKQAVAVCSEALECFGGAGYVEDTGLPLLLRDAQVFSIWEGTTNVLALDAMKVAASTAVFDALQAQARALVSAATDPALVHLGQVALAGLAEARTVLAASLQQDAGAGEANARGVAMRMARCLGLALLVRHAQWSLAGGERRPLLAALRFHAHGLGRLDGEAGARALGMDAA
jgi:alkylation response protein AidB-like acyl-CoA dehydrogenase